MCVTRCERKESSGKGNYHRIGGFFSLFFLGLIFTIKGLSPANDFFWENRDLPVSPGVAESDPRDWGASGGSLGACE